MHFRKSSWLIVIFKFFLITAKKNWNFEIIRVYSNTSNADIFDLSIKLDRISQGVFGLSGFIDVKQDLDDLVANVKVYRSSTGYEKDFKITPFTIDNEHLEQIMNTHYKKHFMEAAKVCGTSSPQFETFKAPLKKWKAEFRKCIVPKDDFPDYMPSGLFKIQITLANEELFTIFIELITSVENPLF